MLRLCHGVDEQFAHNGLDPLRIAVHANLRGPAGETEAQVFGMGLCGEFRLQCMQHRSQVEILHVDADGKQSPVAVMQQTLVPVPKTY